MEESSHGKLISFMLDFDTPHRLGERIEGEDETKVKWLKSSDGVYSTCHDSEIVEKMEDGMYTVFQDSRGAVHAQAANPTTDELYYLPNNHVNDVIKEIGSFWEKAEKFEKHKIKHKRGVLLYGPPGTGKTSIMNLLSSALIENGGLVFSVTNIQELFWFVDFASSHLRMVEPDRPLILIIEDIDTYMDGSGAESALLNFLDGEDSMDHIVVIATTNRYDELNDLVLRPSRFDHHILVEKPDASVREAYLVNKGLDKKTAKKWADDTKDFSLAELKELYTSVILLDLDYKKAKQKINDQADNVTESTFKKPRKKGSSMGFGIGKKD